MPVSKGGGQAPTQVKCGSKVRVSKHSYTGVFFGEDGTAASPTAVPAKGKAPPGSEKVQLRVSAGLNAKSSYAAGYIYSCESGMVLKLFQKVLL